MDFSKVKALQIAGIGNIKSVSVDGKVLWEAGGWVPDVPDAEQLPPPTISLDGDTLTMTATDDRTQEFVIFVNGVKKEAVTVPKETYIVSGTWYFDDNPTFLDYTEDVSFYCGNKLYKQLSVVYDKGYEGEIQYQIAYIDGYGGDANYVVVYDFNSTVRWKNEAYRTITFDGVQEVSKEFYEWLDANAEQQTITFTFDLSTLNLSAGTHAITAKARASGYTDSPASDAVDYVVTPKTEPYWGKYTFHQDLGVIEKNQFPPTAVKFTSNNVNYTQISCGEGTIMYDGAVVYNNKWIDEAYRSIDYGGSENNQQNVDKRFGDWFDVHADVVKSGETDEGGCFVAGTLVLMADGSMKAIEKVVCDDEVLTYDEGTKQYDKGRVLGTIIHNTSRIARLTFASGATVDLTPGHPIYTKEGWKSLKEGDGFAMLKLGNMGLSINGEYDEIVSIEYYTTEAPIEVYNLTIEGDHNYFVGEASVLCHNGGSK